MVLPHGCPLPDYPVGLELKNPFLNRCGGDAVCRRARSVRIEIGIEENGMTTLVADFRADLQAMARQHLTADWGTAVAAISDEDILIAYFDALRRRPAMRPRKIWIADDFACPPGYRAGWEQLQKKVIGGGDFGPHLSKGHARLGTLDGLLNEWNVHHLHLGTAPSPRDPYLIERSGPVLFARITGDDF